jgi:hypothetical protein
MSRAAVWITEHSCKRPNAMRTQATYMVTAKQHYTTIPGEGYYCYSMAPKKILVKLMAVCCTFAPNKPYGVPKHYKTQACGPAYGSKHRYSRTPPVFG